MGNNKNLVYILENAKSRITQLEKDKHKLEEVLYKSKKLYEKQSKREKELKEAIGVYDVTLEEISKDVEKLEKNYKEKIEEISKKDQKNEVLIRNSLKLADNNKELREKNEQLINQKVKLDQIMDTKNIIEKNFNNIYNSYNKLLAEEKELKAKLILKEQNINDLLNKNKYLEEENIKKAKGIDTILQQKLEIEKRIEEIIKSSKISDELSHDLQREKEELSNQLEILKRDYERSKTLLNHLEEEQSTVQESLSNLRRQNKESNDILYSKEKEKEELKSRLNRLQEENESNKEELYEKIREKDRITSELSRLEEEKKFLTKENRLLLEKVEDIEYSLENNKRELKTKEIKIQELEDKVKYITEPVSIPSREGIDETIKIRKVQKELENKERDYQELKTQYETLKSTSYLAQYNQSNDIYDSLKGKKEEIDRLKQIILKKEADERNTYNEIQRLKLELERTKFKGSENTNYTSGISERNNQSKKLEDRIEKLEKSLREKESNFINSQEYLSEKKSENLTPFYEFKNDGVKIQPFLGASPALESPDLSDNTLSSNKKIDTLEEKIVQLEDEVTKKEQEVLGSQNNYETLSSQGNYETPSSQNNFLNPEKENLFNQVKGEKDFIFENESNVSKKVTDLQNGVQDFQKIIDTQNSKLHESDNLLEQQHPNDINNNHSSEKRFLEALEKQHVLETKLNEAVNFLNEKNHHIQKLEQTIANLQLEFNKNANIQKVQELKKQRDDLLDLKRDVYDRFNQIDFDNMTVKELLWLKKTPLWKENSSNVGIYNKLLNIILILIIIAFIIVQGLIIIF